MDKRATSYELLRVREVIYVLKRKLKTIFLTGLAVIIPIGLTLYILTFIINLMDTLLTIIPKR